MHSFRTGDPGGVGPVDEPVRRRACLQRDGACKTSPPVLSGDQLTGIYFTHAYQVTAYRIAAAIPAVLHQQPCYCHCDRALRHNSLHSCFEGAHGATCSTCMKEAVYAYEQTKKGRTPAQIRAGIERGEWQDIDLEKASL